MDLVATCEPWKSAKMCDNNTRPEYKLYDGLIKRLAMTVSVTSFKLLYIYYDKNVFQLNYRKKGKESPPFVNVRVPISFNRDKIITVQIETFFTFFSNYFKTFRTIHVYKTLQMRHECGKTELIFTFSMDSHVYKHVITADRRDCFSFLQI